MLTHAPDLAADVAHLAQERIDLVQAGHLPPPVLLQQCMGSAGAALLRPLVDGHECRRPVGNAHVRAADLRHQGATLGLVQEALQAAHARQAIRARAAARIAGHLEHGEQLRLDLAEARHVQHQGNGALPAVAGAGHQQVQGVQHPLASIGDQLLAVGFDQGQLRLLADHFGGHLAQGGVQQRGAGFVG